jgi:hypothetical protein
MYAVRRHNGPLSSGDPVGVQHARCIHMVHDGVCLVGRLLNT